MACYFFDCRYTSIDVEGFYTFLYFSFCCWTLLLSTISKCFLFQQVSSLLEANFPSCFRTSVSVLLNPPLKVFVMRYKVPMSCFEAASSTSCSSLSTRSLLPFHAFSFPSLSCFKYVSFSGIFSLTDLVDIFFFVFRLCLMNFNVSGGIYFSFFVHNIIHRIHFILGLCHVKLWLHSVLLAHAIVIF